MAAIGAIIKKPSLFKEVWLRYKSLGDEKDAPTFVHTEGVRGEYWCWLKSEDSLKSVDMDKANCQILYDMGCKEMFFEVDKNNKQVYRYHLKVNKAEPIEEIKLPDGRERVLFRKVLKSNK